MDGTELSPEQQKLAVDTIERVYRGEITHPLDIVDEWRAKPSVKRLDRVDESYTTVPVVRVVGTERINTDRLEPKRLARALKLLHDGEYEPERRPPHLALIDREYYVSSDGNHRSLAHKVLGLETMYAEVTVYE